MMNKKKTSRIGLLKYAFLLPVTGLLILAGNARAVTDLASRPAGKLPYTKAG